MYDTMVEDKLKYAFEHIQHVQDQELIILIPFSFLLPHCFSFLPSPSLLLVLLFFLSSIENQPLDPVCAKQALYHGNTLTVLTKFQVVQLFVCLFIWLKVVSLKDWVIWSLVTL